MARYRNVQWNLAGNDGDPFVQTEVIHLALLMDIRDELHRLNNLLACPNFTRMPQTLRDIRAAVRRIPVRKPRRSSAPSAQ